MFQNINYLIIIIKYFKFAYLALIMQPILFQQELVSAMKDFILIRQVNLLVLIEMLAIFVNHVI